MPTRTYRVRWISTTPLGGMSEGLVGDYGTKEEAKVIVKWLMQDDDEAKSDQPIASTSYAIELIEIDEHGNVDVIESVQ